MIRHATLLTLLFTAGCAVGPDYARPETKTPVGLAPIGSSIFTADAPLDRWWEVFADPELDRLVTRAREHNPGLMASWARVEAARAVSRQAFAPLLPTIQQDQQYQYQRQSKRAFGIKNVPDGRVFEGTDSFQSVASLSYELDLWGRIRRSVEAADAELRATDEDRKTVEIALTADVVQTYFDLGAAEERLAIARASVATRTKTVELLRTRRARGVATQLDLAQAEADLATAQTELPDAERERGLAAHRLAILLGELPELSFTGKAPASFAFPPEVPIGIPSQLLERRPDVRKAESNLVAANARIGVAKADYFPRVTIVGRVGYSALDAGKMMTPASQLWSVGPQVTIPIFEGGRVQAAVLEAEARTSEAGFLYREAVLRAFGEVADAIFSIEARRDAREREVNAVRSHEEAATLAASQFRAGLVDSFTVLDAERRLLESRKSLLRAQRALLGELVQLQKALGGGWSERAS
jgi:NodT family efflux transporter outer membrane factor (OMF) lipoprotein